MQLVVDQREHRVEVALAAGPELKQPVGHGRGGLGWFLAHGCADRGGSAVAWIDLRVRRQTDHAFEAALHLVAVAARKVPAAGSSLEDDVAGEQHALALEVEAGRALGVPRCMERGQREIGDVGQRSFVEEVVGVARWDRHRDRGRRALRPESIFIEPVNREPRPRRLLDRGVAVDVIRMAVRVEDLHEAEAVLSGCVDDEPLAHGRIDHESIATIVDHDVGPVVVRRNAPIEDPHRSSLASKVGPCARSRSRTRHRRSP